MLAFRNRRSLSAIALLFSAATTFAAPNATAQVLNFDDVTTNAAGFNSSAFTSYNGYTFEEFGVLTSASLFGTGSNASSPTNFAYGQADGSSWRSLQSPPTAAADHLAGDA